MPVLRCLRFELAKLQESRRSVSNGGVVPEARWLERGVNGIGLDLINRDSDDEVDSSPQAAGT